MRQDHATTDAAGATSADGLSAAQRQLEVRDRERQAVAPRRQGLAYDEIADQLGYAGESGAREAVKRALARTTDPEVEALREQETERIRDLMAWAYAELARDHIVVQFGKVALDPRTGEPLHDSAAVLACVGEIRRLSAELSKLRGLYAPLRTVIEEITQDVVEAEIRRIEAMTAAMETDLRAKGIPIPEVPE